VVLLVVCVLAAALPGIRAARARRRPAVPAGADEQETLTR
jgi:hypothetical protein